MAALGANSKIRQSDTQTGLVRERKDRTVVYPCCCISRESYKVAWTLSELQNPSKHKNGVDRDGLWHCDDVDGSRIDVLSAFAPWAHGGRISEGRQLDIPVVRGVEDMIHSGCC